jgi:regulator of cell morphogenesis and NO signaling
MSEIDGLLSMIESRYHPIPIDRLPAIVGLAETVYALCHDHPSHPARLIEALMRLQDLLTARIRTEAGILCPLIRIGGSPVVAEMVARLRIDQGVAAGQLDDIGAMTGGFRPPADASPSWRALYLALAGLADSLAEYDRVMTDRLFPLIGS